MSRLQSLLGTSVQTAMFQPETKLKPRIKEKLDEYSDIMFGIIKQGQIETKNQHVQTY